MQNHIPWRCHSPLRLGKSVLHQRCCCIRMLKFVPFLLCQRRDNFANSSTTICGYFTSRNSKVQLDHELVHYQLSHHNYQPSLLAKQQPPHSSPGQRVFSHSTSGIRRVDFEAQEKAGKKLQKNVNPSKTLTQHQIFDFASCPPLRHGKILSRNSLSSGGKTRNCWQSQKNRLFSAHNSRLKYMLDPWA